MSWNERLRTKTALALLPTLALLGACDDEDPLGVTDGTEFDAPVLALNASGVSGEAGFTVDEDEDDFVVDIDVEGTVPDALHPQHIHAAARCPTSADDANGDGYVDVVEGVAAYGFILGSLDDNLTAYAANTFPTADADGDVEYDADVSFDAFVTALRGTDMDESDPFVRLGADEALDLESRTYVIHGVSMDTELPETVQSIGGLPAQVTLPVGCAELAFE